MSVIEHFFVLMLENRSFDHMLGFSGITGTDAQTGEPTQIDGLAGTESNSYGGKTYLVSPSATFTMTTDPGHEFPDVVTQLAGPTATFPAGGPYPPVDCSGFAASFAANQGADPSIALLGYDPANLPVLTTLCREFTVCDHWFSALPGPTWPNRFFAVAASSHGLEHSPTLAEIVAWNTIDGFTFPNGTIFDRLRKKQLLYRIYGPRFAITAALKDIGPFEVRSYQHFAADVADPTYSAAFTFIEPDYGNLLDHYRGGTSQHPLDDVRGGEKIIKSTYEALRSSPAWDTSMLIITWDEHGGFYDHAHPPKAPSPGDGVDTQFNQSRFGFDNYGVRVPAVVISPLVPPHLVDHRTYDHTAILATVEQAFGIDPLTARDAAAHSLLDLATLPHARPDAPMTLPDPAGPPVPAAQLTSPSPSHPTASANQGNIPGFLQIALRQDLAVTPARQHRQRIERVGAISTRHDAHNYLQEVHQRVTSNPPAP